MALTDVIATYTPSGSLGIPFAVFTGLDGIIIDTPEQIEEMLTTPGTDGARWRDVYKQFPANRFMTWAECLSDNDYSNRMRRYRDAKTTNGVLVVNFRLITKTWKNVHCEGVQPLPPIPSGIFGFGSGGGPLTAAAIFTFRLTQVST